MNNISARLRNPAFLSTLLIAIFLIALNVVRIFYVPLTYDEAGNYFDKSTYSEIICPNIVSANLHILNSILRKFFIDSFSNNFFFIRLGSLLAQVFFFISLYKLCRLLYTGALWVVCTFLLLNLHPLLFDFWGLGRGYGLAIAFMMASIFCIVNYYTNNRRVFLHLALLSGILSVWSNFTLLDYYFGLAGFILFQPFVFNKNLKLFAAKELPPLLIYTGILYVLIAGIIKKLIAAGQFYYGGTNDIIHDTVYSLIGNDLYIQVNAPNHAILVTGITCFVVVFSIIPGLYWISTRVRNISVERIFTGALLWTLYAVPVMCVLLMHVIFQTKYLLDRTALFLMVLFILQFCYWLYFISRQYDIVGNSIVLMLVSLVSYNFLTNVNISSTRLWWCDEFNIAALKKIVSETGNKKEKTKLSVYWYFEPSIRYYTDGQYSQYFLSIGVIHDEVVNDTSADYYYILTDKASNIPKIYVKDTSFRDGIFTLLRKNKLTTVKHP